MISSHLHLLCKGTDGFVLSDIMLDLKRHTSKKIIQTIQDEPESRREWMLGYFQKACEYLKKVQQYKVWQNGYHEEHLNSIGTGKELLDYRVIDGMENLSRINARILEQSLINQAGKSNLLNIRNSIAPKYRPLHGITP